jgi:hypothetical protein
MRVQRRDGDERGSALVIALVFIALFGLLSAALLSFGFSGERTTNVVTGSRDARYAADGAVEGAIQRFKAMSDGGDPNPCASGGNPFFTYTVRGKTATATCTNTSTGGTPNPPQSLLPTSVTSAADFYPYNGAGTNASLHQSVRYLEASDAFGTVARTDYIRPGNSSISFLYNGVSPPVGSTFQQVNATISHKEGTGVGCCPSQDQSITVTTSDGSNTVNCGTYEVYDAKAVGGPSWPSPAYAIVDITYQQGFQGDSGHFCLNTPTRVQNATITYNAHNTTCGGRTITGVSTTAGSDVLTSTNGNFAAGDITSPQSPITVSGSPNFLQNATTAKSVISATQLQMSKTASQTATNRTVTIGSVCGSVWDTLDGIGICVCLSSRATLATTLNPVCNPALNGGFATGNDPAWQVNHGNVQTPNKDCSQGAGRTPNDGIYEPGDPTQVGGTLNACGSLCGKNSHAWWRDADANVSRSLVLSHFTFDSVGEVKYVSLRISHTEEVANMAVSVTVAYAGGTPCTLAVPTSPTAGQTAPNNRYIADQLLLPEECAPKTAAAMDATTVTYTVTCTPVSGACATGNRNPIAYVDAIVLDLNYELGGSGGTPAANFSASVPGGSTVSANATFGETTQVSNYQVR